MVKISIKNADRNKKSAILKANATQGDEQCHAFIKISSF